MTKEVEKVVKTPEEVKAEKRQYMREYMRRRRQNDPAFLEKQREYKRLDEQKKYETDPDYRSKKSNMNKARYHKYRDAFFQNIEAK